MTFSTANPFVGPVPSSVPLPETPLTGVLVQVKFPEVLSIAKAEFVADFQERIRADYPLHHVDQNPVLELKYDGVRPGSVPHWRFLDATRQWRLSLTTSFIALETRAYESRQDFTQRADRIVQALSTSIKPDLTTRIGVRYVDRIHDSRQQQLSRFVRPEILGLYTDDYRKNFNRTLSEIVSQTDVGPMVARWGFMPENQTYEPELMPPISTPSWFLDVDVYNEFAQPEVFDTVEIKTCTEKLASRAYAFFRWAVNDEFLRACGGRI